MLRLIITVVLLIALSSVSHAKDECLETALFFDENIPSFENLHFDESDKWLPKPGYFELINYYLMSNICGERWALVTVKNISSGTKSLGGENIIALMADGSKRKGNVGKRVKEFSTETFSISFGTSKVPIIKLLVNTK